MDGGGLAVDAVAVLSLVSLVPLMAVDIICQGVIRLCATLEINLKDVGVAMEEKAGRGREEVAGSGSGCCGCGCGFRLSNK